MQVTKRETDREKTGNKRDQTREIVSKHKEIASEKKVNTGANKTSSHLAWRIFEVR